MPQLSYRRRMLVLVICCTSLLITGLDNTIVNIALPAISHDLRASISGLQWIVDAYMLVLASLLMLSGSTADRLGRRRVFQTGLTLFTISSLLCSLAPSLGWLVTFRMVQALGGSMLTPVALSIISNVFTDRAERARAIGVWAGVLGISYALGPVVGGALIGTAGWRAIFWINIPIGLAAVLLCQLFVPESKATHPRRADPVGQALVIVLLASLVYAIIEGPHTGWGSTPIVGCFTLASLALAGFLSYERRRREPLIDLRFFRSAPFAGATVIAVCGMASLGGFLFLTALYLQEVRGLPALTAGLCLLPIAVMSLVASPISGRMVAKRGSRSPLLIAGTSLAVAAVLQIGIQPDTSLIWVIVIYTVFGIGFGMQQPPITNTAIAGMPIAQAAVAASIASTSRQVGQALGVAVIGAAVSSRIHGPLSSGFTDASHLGWWIIAGCGAAVFVLGIVTTGRWAKGTAAAVAAIDFEPAAGQPEMTPAKQLLERRAKI